MIGIFDKEELKYLLQLRGAEQQSLLERARITRDKTVGNSCYLRGLIELSNYCCKDCLYCGIRKGNKNITRYDLPDQEIFSSVQYAFDNGYGSVVIQSGENTSASFIRRITSLIDHIRKNYGNNLQITLSLGEQSEDTYQRWFDAGASRYLLRIESSVPSLYKQIHPQDRLHQYSCRISALQNLKRIGYQVGTGVMIGLPFQTTEILAEDLLFMQRLDIDMCGMGPYLEHRETPLYEYRSLIPSLSERFSLSLNMIALLRLMMPSINIAATTALQAIDKEGREKGLKAGANVIMPNITPVHSRESYQLYENKPLSEAGNSNLGLYQRIEQAGCRIAFNEAGTSAHFLNKKSHNS